jgi:putative transcriptional regulator
MAIVRMNARRAKAAGQIDRKKIAATTESDIRRHQIEDGENPDETLDNFKLVVPVAKVREKFGMTQAKFAATLRIPLPTIRNWEQGRVRPDPAAQTLLTLLYRRPDAIRALQEKKSDDTAA